MSLQTNLVSNNVLETMNSKKATTASTSNAAETEDRFLKLLVTQMKNQDPLNPLDNAQVTSQMAQLSTVTGIDKLNDTVKGLEASYQASQSLQSAALIGRGVLTPGNEVHLKDHKAIFGIEMLEPADNVTVTVLDAAKNPVYSVDMGAKDVGITPITWDGMSGTGTQKPDGRYTVEVTATRGGKKVAEAVQGLSFGMVGSVSTNAQGIKVNLNGVGPVDLAAVRQIL